MQELDFLAFAPSPAVFDAAVSLVNSNAVSPLGKTQDAQPAVFGECAGSGAVPYRVSVVISDAAPLTKCNCASRQRPCKHALALLVAFVRDAGRFPTAAEVPPELRIAVKAPKAKSKTPPKPKKVNAAAQAKKVETQLQGLAVAEQALVDLMNVGVAMAGASGADALRSRAKDVADFHLPGLALAFRRLASQLTEKTPAAKYAVGFTRELAQLWVTVQRGRDFLSDKLDAAQASDANENEAVLDELLGRTWQLAELKERGFAKKLSLVELAYERIEDPDRDERVETSYLVDLDEGAVFRDIAYIPSRRTKATTPKTSYQAVLELAEAAVYPGISNRRVRIEADGCVERPIDDTVRATIISKALSVAQASSQFVKQLKNVLAPNQAVMVVGVKQLAKVGEGYVLVDGDGGRLPIATAPSAERSLKLLERLGVPSNLGAALVRLSLNPQSGNIDAEVMTLVTSTHFVRLSL